MSTEQNAPEPATITGSACRIVRVAVAQLAYHPAIRGALVDPLGESDPEGKQPVSTLPRGFVPAQDALGKAHVELSKRIEAAYLDQLSRKLRAIVAACRTWNVRLLVLPEYSVPVGALAAIAAVAGDMVVVAGSCFVDRTVQSDPAYRELRAPRKPERRWNVAHILHKGRIVALVPKMDATPEEQTLSMEPATEWEPVEIPEDFGGPLGVLICLDYLHRGSDAFHQLVGSKLDRCRVIAAPALTSESSQRFFEGHHIEESGPERRPVLFANHAPGGGSTIVAGERAMEEVREYPLHAGALERGEEGVLVSDLDLAVVGVGKGGRYGEARRCTPFAAASLVYAATNPEVTKWLSELRAVLPEMSTDEDEDDVVDRSVDWLGDHPPPPAHSSSAQKRRWARLAGNLPYETSAESLRRLTREILLPPEVLPLEVLQDALAKGASREMQRWTHGGYQGAAPFATVAENLAERARKSESRRATWPQAARDAWAGIAEAVRGPAEKAPQAFTTPLDRATDTVENEVVRKGLDEGNTLAQAGRLDEARTAFERALAEADRQGQGNEVHGDKWRVWAARAAIGAAMCSSNLQDAEGARGFLARIPADALDARRRVRAANLWAGLGEVERARALLPAEPLSEEDARTAHDVQLRIDLAKGRLPSDEELASSPDVALIAVFELLTKHHDAAHAARLALGVLNTPNAGRLIHAEALRLLVAALVQTTIEVPAAIGVIPQEERASVVTKIESFLPELLTARLPASTLEALRTGWRSLLELAEDTDALSALDGMSALAAPTTSTTNANETEEEKSWRTAMQTAERLAREGHVEAALQTLPPDEHPWRGRLFRVDVLQLAGQHERALTEAQRLSAELPGRARIEMTTAQLLSAAGQKSEALEHALAAYKALPARGVRVLVAEQFLALRRADEAWDLLTQDEQSAGPRILRALAFAADLAHPERAIERWQKYVAAKPRDAGAQVQLARVLFAQSQPEQAAQVAWTTFEAHADTLDVEDLHALATLQGAPLPDVEQRRRVQLVAAMLRQRFPGDPNAEHARFALLTRIGSIDSGGGVDFALLESAGFVRAVKTSELLDLARTQTRITASIQQLGKQGWLPVALLCGAVTPPVSVPLVIARLMYGSGGEVPFSPPVGLPPGFRLKGSQLLVSNVELYILGALGLLSTLAERVDGGGIHLFHSERMRVVQDRAALGAQADERRREAVDRTVAALASLPRLAPGADERGMSDEELAIRRGMMVVDSARDEELRAAGIGSDLPEEQRTSPRAVIQWLKNEGGISADVASKIDRFFERDAKTPRPASTQGPVLVSAFLLEKMHVYGALRAFLDLFPDAHIGENAWRALLGRQAAAVEDRKAAELAAEVHAWISENMRGGLVHMVPDPKPEALPATLDPNDEVLDRLVREPLHWAAGYADTLTAHRSWWRVTADFVGSTSPIAPDAVLHLAWTDPESEVKALVARLRGGTERHVSIPVLLRELLGLPEDEQRRHQALFKLAELGFPDALGEDEIISLFHAYGGLEGQAPTRILDRLEWMAREPGHLGGDTARLRLATVYSAAVFRAFCGTPTEDGPLRASEPDLNRGNGLPVLQAQALARTLLGRAEALSQRQRCDFLDSMIRFLAASTASNPRLAWEPNATKDGWDRKLDSPLAPLWAFVQTWAGPDGQRRAACERGVREVWLLVDGERNDARRALISAALDHAVERRHSTGLRFTSIAVETEAILSALWTWKPTTIRGIGISRPGAPEQAATYEDVLALGALPETHLGFDPVGQFLRFHFPVPDGSGFLDVAAPAEAILLREPPEAAKTQELANKLRQSQGSLDGRAYNLLAGFARHPSRGSIRRAVARRAVSTLWRAVRDDPTYLVRWPRSRGIASGGAKPTLRELRAILSEPGELGPVDAHLGVLLLQRFEEGGVWQHREDAGALLRMASEVPGGLMFAPVGLRLANGYEGHVEEAIEIAEHSEDQPIARVGQAILLLRAGAARSPLVKLPAGESIDLREKLPHLLRVVLARTIANPNPGTFADAEPGLLRLCVQVLFDLAGKQPLSIRDGIWLTYRLFQWLCDQLEALPLDGYSTALRDLIALAPNSVGGVDRLDPRGFSRDTFDHRLATILYALAAMQEVGVLTDGVAPSAEAVPYSLAWHSAMIDNLVDLAGRLDESPGLRSVLPWDAPDNISDLALVALLRLDSNEFARVPAPARLARIRRLPVDPDAMDTAARALFLPLVMQASVFAESLSEEERNELLSRIRALPPTGEIARGWRMQVLTALYAQEGTDVTEAEAMHALQERLDSRLAPMALTFLLLGTAARDVSRIRAVLDGVLQEAERRGVDPIPLVTGVGRLTLFVEEPVRATLVELIRALATKPPFNEDERMRELMAALGSP